MNLPDSLFFADPLTIGAPVLAQWNAEHVHFLASGSRPGRGAAAADVRVVRRFSHGNALG